MCGLIGLFRGDDKLAWSQAEALQKVDGALRALTHRGPDGSGTWADPHCSAALGHRRLSVVDLDGGAQPLTSPDGSVVAVVNGEFYCHDEIRDDLRRRGYQFKTKSDSEILIPLYEEYGTDCLEHLRGEFAFILYDRREQQIFVARDRFGIKPMFFASHDGTLYFGSEIKSLIAAGVPAVWDEESYISRGFNFGNSTLFKGVKSLPPGSFCIATKRGQRFQKYWDLVYPEHSALAVEGHSGDAVSRVRASLEEAVRIRMQADVPVAYYLSGGVDSSAVLAIAAKMAGDSRMPAFTIAFTGDKSEEFDESAYARLMACHVNAEHHLVEVSGKMLADNFDKAIWHNEFPFFNAHGVGKFILSGAVQKAGYKVVMTGEGADEIFAGYPHFRRDKERLESAELASSPGPIHKYTAGINRPECLEAILGCGVSWIENQNGLISRIMPLFNREMTLRTGDADPIRAFIESVDVKARISARHPVHIAMYLWAKSFLPNFVLTTLGDRMEMAHSVEGRTPFLDHRLAEVSTAVPISMKIQGKTEKHVLREAMRSYVPEVIRLRKKHYFRAPTSLHGLGTDPMGEKIFDMLHSSLMDSVPFFEKKSVHELLNRTRTASRGELQLVDPVLTEIASLCAMQDQFSLGVV